MKMFKPYPLMFALLMTLFIATACSSSDESIADSTDGCTVVTLAADIWPGPASAAPGPQLALNGRLYFTANDGVHGEELWRFSPITGAELVHDIAPGTGGSNPGPYAVMNDRLYFSANDNMLGEELWVFDPDNATAGATLVEDIHNGNSNSSPDNFTVIDDSLYFTGFDEVYGDEPRVYTEDSGVSLVADIRPGDSSSDPDAFTFFEGDLLFTATGEDDHELWSLNIDSGELQQIPFNVDDVENISLHTAAEYAGKLFFPLDDDIHGTELWTYSKDTGAALVVDLNPEGNDSYPFDFNVIDDKLYFGADDGVSGRELRSYDAEQGVLLVADINPGYLPPGYFGESTLLDGKLYFQAYESVHGAEIWVFDPLDGASLLADLKINGGDWWYDPPSSLVVFDDKLYFRTYDEENGSQQWFFDPVNAENGPVLFDEVWPGSHIDEPPQNLTELDGKLYFSADDGIHGNELWTYDPSCK